MNLQDIYIVNAKNNLTFTISIILNASQIRAQMRTPCVSANSKRQINLSFTITSLTDLDEFADSVRKHWSIENNLYWCLDVIFHEDTSRARKDNSPLNLNILWKIALNLVSQAQYKRISKKRLMFRASLEPTLFLNILFDPSSVLPQ